MQEIQAVDRLFPALDQVEMQLACKHILSAVSCSDKNGSAGSAAPPSLQIPSSQSATADVPTDLSCQASQDGGQVRAPPPEWLQQRDSLDSWILENLNDGPRRLKMVHMLVKMAAPFRYGASKVIKALGNLNSENVS